MFNLDQAIAEWRRQMLSAGIKTPVPLDELESHLREEFERQTKSGLSEAQAFQAAAGIIGEARVFQKEFKKVEKGHNIIRVILLGIGWLAAGCILLYGIVGLDFDWNFFHFSPRWNLGVMVELSGIPLALTSMWFLAKASRDRASRAVSLLVCVLLVGLAVLGLHQDENAKGIFGGHYHIPLWYRGGRTWLLCLPGVFWIWWTRRQLAQKRGPTHGNQPIHSD
jgi:hypothetical protein